MGIAHGYAAAVQHRARVPMESPGYEPPWADSPRDGRLYPGTELFPLPDFADGPEASLLRALTPESSYAEAGRFNLQLLSGILQDSCGLLARRLALHANMNVDALPNYPLACWSRGAASGGGLYPVHAHWICGPSGPLTPGVYHYNARHHAMQRLLAGDVSGQVAEALGLEAASDADQFLVLEVKFWRNSFKYQDFCYHVVAMDVGALLGAWRLWAHAHGLRINPVLWFDEPKLTRLLGLVHSRDGVFAVVPLQWDQSSDSMRHPISPSAAPNARVQLTDRERSRTVRSFDLLDQMQAATLDQAAERPPHAALTYAFVRPEPADGDRIVLPAPGASGNQDHDPLGRSLRSALRSRRSSFGQFSAQRPLSVAHLAAILAAAHCGARLDCDAEPPAEDEGSLIRLYVCANHVESVTPGTYAYDPHNSNGPSLRLVAPGNPGSFVQSNYKMNNYNVEQAGAVLVVSARTAAVLDQVGDRGYRLVAAAVGAAAQTIYTACAAAGLGCGAALGFDADSYAELLGLTDSDETPLLILMLGYERPNPADFRYKLL